MAQGVNPATGGKYEPWASRTGSFSQGTGDSGGTYTNPLDVIKAGIATAANQPLPPAPIAEGTVGNKGFLDSFVEGTSSVAGSAVNLIPGARSVVNWGAQKAGEELLSYGNRHREREGPSEGPYAGSGGYASEHNIMNPAQNITNAVENRFLDAGARGGQILQDRYEAYAGYAKAAKFAVTHPVEVPGKIAALPGIVAANIAADPWGFLERSAVNVLTDPVTYTGAGLVGGAMTAERTAARTARQATEEALATGASREVADVAGVAARRASAAGKFTEAVENIPTLRQIAHMKPEGLKVRVKRAIAEKVAPGPRESALGAIAKERFIGSPTPPDPGGAFGLRQGMYRAGRAGTIIGAPSAYRAFEHFGQKLYDPHRFIPAQYRDQVAQIEDALNQAREQGLNPEDAIAQYKDPLAQQTLMDRLQQAAPEAAVAGVAGLTAGALAGGAVAPELSHFLKGRRSEETEPEPAANLLPPLEQPKPYEFNIPEVDLNSRKIGPRNRYNNGRGFRLSSGESRLFAQGSRYGAGFWQGRSELTGPGWGGELNRYSPRPIVPRGYPSPRSPMGRQFQQQQQQQQPSIYNTYNTDNSFRMGDLTTGDINVTGDVYGQAPELSAPSGEGPGPLVPGPTLVGGPSDLPDPNDPYSKYIGVDQELNRKREEI